MSEDVTYQWTPERQIGYPLIMEVAPSPDGRRVAYVVREPLLREDKSEFITHLYLAGSDGEPPVQLTYGEHRNTTPRWSPDGHTIAFLSTRHGEKANLYAMRAAGGEAWPLTAYEKTSIADLRWSRDGTRIGYLMAEPVSEEKEKARKGRDDARVFDQDWDFTHLYAVPFAVGPRTLPDPVRITKGRMQVVAFDWLADGERLAIAHRPTPMADTWLETRLALVSADGSGEQQDLGPAGNYLPNVRVSPDGRWIAAETGDQPLRWAFSNRVVLHPTEGGTPRPLAPTPDAQAFLFGWSGDSQEVYVFEMRGTGSALLALPISGAAPRPLTESPLHLSPLAASAQGHIAVAGQDLHQPHAVYLLDAHGQLEKIAQPPLPPEWPEAPLPRVEVIEWQSPDGQTIEGMLTYPLDHQPGTPCPLILHIHGGPAGVFSRAFVGAPVRDALLPMLAEHGYAVLQANPRGSSGYGREFRFANYQDWGAGDYQDIMAGVDHLIARGIADPDRLGVMGWSYGGFMTSWTITQTDRFKAACVGAAVTNPLSFNGTSDIPRFIPDYFGAEGWDDLERYRRHSPILHAANVRTPALIVHGEADVRVPVTQGREFHNALKGRGVPVELVIYPREDHSFAEPRHRMDLYRRGVAWFDKWILGRSE